MSFIFSTRAKDQPKKASSLIFSPRNTEQSKFGQLTAEGLRDELQYFAINTLDTALEDLRMNIQSDLLEAFQESPRADLSGSPARSKFAKRSKSAHSNMSARSGRSERMSDRRIDGDDAGSWVQLLKRRHMGFGRSRSSLSGLLSANASDKATEANETVLSNHEETKEDVIDVDSWVVSARYSAMLIPEEQIALTAEDSSMQIIQAHTSPNGWRERSELVFKPCLRSARFEQFIGLVILINSVVLGVEASADSATMRSVASILETNFSLFFAVEWSLRFHFFFRTFFTGDDWMWNIFDTLINAIQFLHELSCLSTWLHIHSTANMHGVIRTVLLFRVARLLRVLRLFPELRALTSTISQSLGPLGWTLSLFGVMMYCFAIILAETIKGIGSKNDDLAYWFGSLSRTLLTLFECLLSGVSWDIVVKVLLDNVSLTAGVALCFYTGVGLLILLNVLTGLFVQKAMHTAQQESDMDMARRLGDMYRRLAEDNGTKNIDLKLFETGMDSVEMQEYLKAVNIDPSEAKNLFDLIDLDRDGNLDIDEIVQGCLRLRGDAKALDLTLLMHHMINMHEESLRNEENVRAKLGQIAEQMGVAELSPKFSERADERKVPQPLKKETSFHIRRGMTQQMLNESIEHVEDNDLAA